MQNHEETKTVALYARVSSDKQDMELSIGAQLSNLRKYARQKGYLVHQTYVDEGISGTRADRPAFRQMMAEATKRSPPFREILVWSLFQVLPGHGSIHHEQG